MTTICGNNSGEPCAKRAKVDDGSEELALVQSDLDDDDDDIEDFDKQLSYIGSQLAELKLGNEQLETKVALNESQIDFFKRQVEELDVKWTKLEARLKEKNNTISNMKKQIDDLQKKVDEYDEDRKQLYLCQVAVEFEHAVCSHVLPEVFKDDKYATIRRLLKILNDGGRLPFVPKCCKDETGKADPSKKESMLKEARNQWEKLCVHLNLPEKWKTDKGKKAFDLDDLDNSDIPGIFRAIPLLKDKRNPIAHPNPVNLKKAADILTKLRGVENGHFLDWQLDLLEIDFIVPFRKLVEMGAICVDRNKLEL